MSWRAVAAVWGAGRGAGRREGRLGRWARRRALCQSAAACAGGRAASGPGRVREEVARKCGSPQLVVEVCWEGATRTAASVPVAGTAAAACPRASELVTSTTHTPPVARLLSTAIHVLYTHGVSRHGRHLLRLDARESCHSTLCDCAGAIPTATSQAAQRHAQEAAPPFTGASRSATVHASGIASRALAASPHWPAASPRRSRATGHHHCHLARLRSRALCCRQLSRRPRVAGLQTTFPRAPGRTALANGTIRNRSRVSCVTHRPSSWRGRPRGAPDPSHRAPPSVLQVVSRVGANSLNQYI